MKQTLLRYTTPGPWKASRLGPIPRPIRISGAGAYRISPANGPSFAYLPEGAADIQDANARLIEKAPDLLATLIEVQRLLGHADTLDTIKKLVDETLSGVGGTRLFKVWLDREQSEFIVHRAGCPDLPKILRRDPDPWILDIEAETPQEAAKIALAEEFGSGTDRRSGVERNDCTMGDVGYTARVLPCARRGVGA